MDELHRSETPQQNVRTSRGGRHPNLAHVLLAFVIVATPLVTQQMLRPRLISTASSSSVPKSQPQEEHHYYHHPSLTSDDNTAAADNPVVVAKSEPPQLHSHFFPSYFTDEVELDRLLQRANLIEVYSGCRMAAWSYDGERTKYKRHNDCYHDADRFHDNGTAWLERRSIRPETAAERVVENDTVYVPFLKLNHFYNYTLPNITADFVLISSMCVKIPPEWIANETFEGIVNHPHVLKWFMANMDMYAKDPYHPKLHPWPYGVHFMDKERYLPEIKNYSHVEKNVKVYVGHIEKQNNFAARLDVPSTKRVKQEVFFNQLHHSYYVLSPDGDRPECYRHYEALGLGSVPITQLHPYYHSHLAPGPIIYNQTDWNVTIMEETLPSKPQVNRRMVFQEYWMEYVERIVGRPLRWWDPSRNILTDLANITSLVQEMPDNI